MKLTVTKLFPSGALEIVAVISGQLVRRCYLGYSRRVACAMFRNDVNA